MHIFSKYPEKFLLILLQVHFVTVSNENIFHKRRAGGAAQKISRVSAKRLPFSRADGKILPMEERADYLRALDEHFCARYSDYVRLSAIEGYHMPEVLYVAKDGNIARRDPSCMRLCYQEQPEVLLARFKEGLADTEYTFSFRFPKLREKVSGLFHPKRPTFAHELPAALAHCNETAESAGEKLAVEPRFWQQIVKGKLYPEKNTVLALALVCRMQLEDVQTLLSVCGFTLDAANIRDVVVDYLIVQKIFNPEMRDACLREYGLVNLPIRT